MADDAMTMGTVSVRFIRAVQRGFKTTAGSHKAPDFTVGTVSEKSLKGQTVSHQIK